MSSFYELAENDAAFQNTEFTQTFYTELEQWIRSDDAADDAALLAPRKLMKWYDDCFRILMINGNDAGKKMLEKLLGFFAKRIATSTAFFAKLEESATFVAANPVFPNRDINSHIVSMLKQDLQLERVEHFKTYMSKAAMVDRICAYIKRFHMPASAGSAINVPHFGRLQYAPTFEGMAIDMIAKADDGKLIPALPK